jgi:gliding motility-associated-like protein
VTSTETKKDYIEVFETPKPDFIANPLGGCYPLQIDFLDNSTSGTDVITSYYWDFGDGNFSFDESPSHIYEVAGIFDIALQVVNSKGCKNLLSKPDYIRIESGVIAGFKISNMDVCNTPAQVSFTNTSQGEGNLNYLWDFGDGTTSQELGPTHSYQAAGTYQVSLRVSNSAGCLDTASVTLDIGIPESAVVAPDTICTGQSVQFFNKATPTPISNTWIFSNGETSSSLNPLMTFNDAGTYTAFVISQFSSTCYDTSEVVTFRVFSGPTASFRTDDTANCTAPYSVQFQNNTASATSFLWNFGDGNTSTLENPLHIYNRTGIFTVSLTAFNVSGCKQTQIIPDYIKINPVKILGITGLPDSGCIPHTIYPRVLLNINAKISKILWNFGDGTSSSLLQPSHKYSKEGSYTVSVKITTNDGCTDEYTMFGAVQVGHKPEANFIVDPPEICAYETTQLINTSTQGPIHFLSWNFLPLTDASQDSIHIYEPSDTGYIPLTLIAYNYGCADTVIYDSLLYVRPPVAKFDYTVDCTSKLTVDFEDKSIGETSRDWTFGDGTSDTAAVASHTYVLPGTYEVEIIARNEHCADTASKKVFIINEKGVLKLSGNEFCRNELVECEITNVQPSNISSTFWDFGDGTTQLVAGLITTHPYTKTGVYLIKVTMTDINGCTYDYEAPDSVYIYGPSARFTAEDPTICKNSKATFNDLSKSDGIHPIVNWTWNFGDGTVRTYTTPPFFNVYKDTGQYDVKLIVEDSYGCVDSNRKVNHVLVSFPYPSYNHPDSIICPGKTVEFQNTSIGRNLTYIWAFGDGNMSTIEQATNTYITTGTYKPLLTATDENGCIDSFSFRPIVVDIPTASFLVSDSFSSCPPLLVEFKNNSTSFIGSYWDFGNGNNSNLFAPTHLYTDAGLYTVKLRVYGSGGCVDSVSKVINILGPSGTFLYPKKTVCFPDSIQFNATVKNTRLITWDFSDGEVFSTTDTATSHQYDVGFYVPRMILDDGMGCKVAVRGKDTIRVVSVQANASVTGNPACDSSLVYFTSMSTSQDSIISHYWDFGDGSFTDSSYTSHKYTRPGTYNTTLTVTTKEGCVDAISLPSDILVALSPMMRLLGPEKICEGSTAEWVAINDAPDTSTLSYSWKTDVGVSISGAATGMLSFDTAGTFQFNLLATNSYGCSDSVSTLVIVQPAPTVSAGLDKSACQNQTISLHASGGTSYLWMGDGLSCTDCADPLVSVSSSGYYVVIGTDDLGCNSTDTVFVKAISPVTLEVGKGDTVCVGTKVTFKASGADSYRWYPSQYLSDPFSDSPQYQNTTAGTFTYKVVGYSEQNCFLDSGFVTVKSYPIPTMEIREKEVVLSAGGQAQLHTNNSPDINQWQWQPMSGLDNPFSSAPIVTPKETTTYLCIASNGGGCLVRDEIVVRVVCKNSNIYIPNTFSPNNDGMNERFYVRGTGLFSIKSTKIFNRWGQLIYEKLNAAPNNGLDGWNGTYNGILQQPDVYVYIIEVQCENGAIIPVKGNVTLLR